MAQTALVEVERVELRTERLLLQPVEPAHAQGLFEATVASRPELLPWMPWAREPKLEGSFEAAAAGLRDWLEGTAFHFAVVESGTGLVLGVVGLNPEDDGAAELHYWIRTDHAGRGLTTEACLAVIEWAHGLGLARLTLWAGRDNHASRRVAVKLGFQHLGPLGWEPEGGLGTFPAERYERIV